MDNSRVISKGVNDVKIRITKFTAFIFTFLFFSVCLRAQDIPMLYKKALPSIVKIRTLDKGGLESGGTGFFISQNIIVTCYHVVSNINSIEIITSDGIQLTVDTVIASNRDTDLIKLKVKERSKNWLTVLTKLPDIGESVFVIGNPEGYDFSLSSGLISGIRTEDSTQIIQITAPVSSGNSGGPLLDKNGNVVGVLSYVKYSGQNLNFAAAANNILNLRNDFTIQQLISLPVNLNKRQVDSIMSLAKDYMLTKNYSMALSLALTVIDHTEDRKYLDILELVSNCHFLNRDYITSAQYFHLLTIKLQGQEKHSAEDIWIYSNALLKKASCHRNLGDNSGAIEILKEAVRASKAGYENDTTRQELYKLLLQQIFITDAIAKFSVEMTFEACLSWKRQKNMAIKTLTLILKVFANSLREILPTFLLPIPQFFCNLFETAASNSIGICEQEFQSLPVYQSYNLSAEIA